MDVHGATATEYRQSAGALVAAAVGGLVIAGLVTLAGLAFLPGWSIPLRTNRPLVASISFSAGGLVLLLSWLSVFWWNRFSVLVDSSRVTVSKAFRTVAEFDARAVKVRSHVLKRTTNGVPSSTTRTLIVEAGGLEQRFTCPRFSRETFSAMISQLQALAAPQPAPVGNGLPTGTQRSGQNQAPVQSQGFQLNREALSLRSRRLLIVIGILIAAVLGYVAFLQFSSGPEDVFIGLVLAGSLAGMVLVFCFIALAAVARVKNQTPDRVGVDHGGIYLDQEYFPFAGLRRIQATPPDYGISQHNRLELLAADGRKHSVLLGLNSDRGKRPVFPEYPQFVALLQRAAAPWPGLLVMDLQ
ncbi:MAG: hypothetical protein IIZ13_01030 [Renibacterium sp.]|nr:hypothetical protein [Renibacterium sp.]